MPIGNAAIHLADVNEVKMIFRIDPFTTAVIDLEVEVRDRNTRLNWGKIGA